MRRKTPFRAVLRRIGQILWSLGAHLPELRSGGPAYARAVVEDLGGGIVKLAQIVALRYDLLPARYCQALSRLFDHLPPLAGEEIRQIIREEHGKNPEDIFERFSYEPRATASFGQVHRAVLNGTPVAVKVQKPNLWPRVHADIALIKALTRFIDWLWAGAPVDLRDAVHEWESWTLKEMDYRIELSNAQRFRNSNPSPYIYIPRVFPEQSTGRVLVTEFLEGPNLNEIHRRQLPLPPRTRAEVTRAMIWSNLLDYFMGGFFHADPHLGNLILLPDGRLGVVDFGIMGEAGTPLQNYHFAHFMKSAADGAVRVAADHFLEFMRATHDAPFKPLETGSLRYHWRGKSPERIRKGIAKFLEDKFISIMAQWADNVEKPGERLAERSTARYFISLVATARESGLEIPTNLLAFIRATIIADMVCLVLNPAFNMREELQLFFRSHPEVCQTLAEGLRPTVSEPAVQPAAVARPETVREQEIEERQRILERYLEYASRIIERVLEGGTRGLAYFSTTKV